MICGIDLARRRCRCLRYSGLGEKTYCRWESGLFIQSVAFDNYLRLIRDVPEAAARLMRIEHGEVTEVAEPIELNEPEFGFLKNIGGMNESAAKFTQLMTTGMLHVPVSGHGGR